MTEIVPNLPFIPANQPFNDIVNRNLDKVYEDVQNKAVKSLNTIALQKNQEQPLEKQNKIEDSSKPQDKTIKKQTNVQNLNLMSAKTIHKDLGFGSQQLFDNPEWDFLNNIQCEEISHIIRFEGQFNTLTTYFLQYSRKLKLSMCQQTDTFVTVKKGGIGSCRCIFKIWSNNDSDATVYQIRKFGRNNQRAKLILVEGDQVPFHRFFMRFLSILEQKKLVKILPGQRVQLIFDKQSQKTLEYQKASKNIMKRLNKSKVVKYEEIQQLTMNIHSQAIRLIEVLGKIPNLTDIPTLQRQIQDLCFNTSGIYQIYEKINQNDYEQYRRKREKILKKHNFGQLFQQLQISEHFQQFKRLRSLKQIDLSEEKIPYMSSIRQLKRFASLTSSSAALQAIVVFHQKIRVSYQNYCKNTMKVGDMDEYLPITIFCVLAVDCQANFLALVKFLIAQLSNSDEREWQKKTLTDLQAAFEYILRQWEQQK